MDQPDLTAKLARLKREALREWRSRVRAVRRSVRRATRPDALTAALFVLLKTITLVVLPFLVYVRTAVYLYVQRGITPWLAILGAALLTLGVVAGSMALLMRGSVRRARLTAMLKWIAVPVVFTWCMYAAFYLSRVNAKTDDVRAYYRAVNPILRVALSTVVLVDSDLIITDMARVRGDYARMGLPVNERTKHYRQPNGWVHAVDLRTRERGEIRNRLLQLYFWTMGFSTLRHVGTADHLHVQLAVRE